MPKGLRKIEISVGEHNLTHFGGILLFHRFCKKLKLKWILQRGIRFSKRYGQYHPTDLILAMIYALIVGIHRLSQTKILQGNGAFQKIIGLESFPYASSLRRFLKRIDLPTLQSLIKAHDQLRSKMLTYPKPPSRILLDFDSTVLTLYGRLIEGAKVGYNPHKKGKRSYHPLLCFESNTQDFWHGTLRAGDAYTAQGSVEFLKASLAKIPSSVYRIRIRADSGFFDHKFIEPLDEKGIGYVIVAKMTSAIRDKLEGLRCHHFKKDWGAAEFNYTPFNWENPHRFIVIRRPLPEKESDQLTLFTLTRYAYQVFVTNLDIQPEHVWYFYRGRAGIEVFIKELKQDYALAKIPTRNFMANQVYFQLLLLAYNLVNWFKRLCLPAKFQHATLQTIRSELLVLPARLVNAGHQNILKLPAEYLSQKMLTSIIQKIQKVCLH
ncbi:MAG: IS1380 family transposase [Candidatus Portnoybacteria bacterium]|nr:IS1380 family transposase [Candidatus Portnoybacteria bacterium]